MSTLENGRFKFKLALRFKDKDWIKDQIIPLPIDSEGLPRNPSWRNLYKENVIQKCDIEQKISKKKKSEISSD